MSARIGVDVGGTFTKAVAVDLEHGGLVARAVVPTTHDALDGVAVGVVEAVRDIVRSVDPASVELVTHSTTQAVNALLEGDVGTVGVIGLARRSDMRKATKRTALRHVELAPGKPLRTEHRMLDTTDGLDEAAARSALGELLDAGAGAICVAEAFSPDDDSNERAVADLAAGLGLAACTSSELSGLYGLEMRAVTGAINASVVPIAVATADIVEQGVRDAGITSPVMVMRGDGGATDLDGFRKAPVRTLYSGPAASVAGALRYAHVSDGVVVEVGGTSTNVAAIERGRPSQSYVRVASHATAVRALDVRVIGVAGGSMLRTHKRKVYGVGPRSAHIAGLPYSCFADAAAFAGATTVELSPSTGDPADYLAIQTPDGARLALTNTCAANRLGIVRTGDYAYAPGESATLAFDIAGEHLRLDGAEVAGRMLEASGNAVGQLVTELVSERKLTRPTLVSVGGGAGGLGRYVADLLSLPCVVPEGAEVISSIGDALSLVSATRERAIENPSADDIEALVREVEREALATGASPASLSIRTEYVGERRALRVVATGAIGLEAGAVPGREAADGNEIRQRMTTLGVDSVSTRCGSYWVGCGGRRVVVLDRFADLVVAAEGEIVERHEGQDLRRALEDAIRRNTKAMGPVQVDPSIWVVADTRVTELGAGDVVDTAAQLVVDGATLIVGRT